MNDGFPLKRVDPLVTFCLFWSEGSAGTCITDTFTGHQGMGRSALTDIHICTQHLCSV